MLCNIKNLGAIPIMFPLKRFLLKFPLDVQVQMSLYVAYFFPIEKIKKWKYIGIKIN